MWYVAVGSVYVFPVAGRDVADDYSAIVRTRPTDSPKALAALREAGTEMEDGGYRVPGAYYVDPLDS